MITSMSREMLLLAVCLALSCHVGYSTEVAYDEEVAMAEEEAMGSIDDIITDAANSSLQFDFVFDEASRLVKMELDMLYTFEEARQLEEERNETTRKKRTAGIKTNRWSNNVVPYQLSSVFSSRDRSAISAAIRDWERYTCLDFRPATRGNRIYMQNGGGCYSRVGMVGGAQQLGLAPGCRVKGVIIHEIGHALGLHHEQTRPDRDQHVSIIYSNIPRRVAYNFHKNSWRTIMNMGIPYDYTSIMHYGKTAFSTNGGLTIRTKDPAKQNVIGNRHGLSFRDIKSVNIMYNCKRHKRGCTKTDSQCPGEGFVGKDCTCVCPGGGLRNPTRSCSGTGTGGGRVTTRRPVTSRPRPITTPRPRPTGCRNMHRSCGYWARIGECRKNPSYMLSYCKAACNVCNGGGGSRVCRNQKSSASCTYWKRVGYCTSWRWRNYMEQNCRKTCGVCGRNSDSAAEASTCTDQDHNCASWARNGECQRNPAYMLSSCKRSCNQCGSGSNAAAPTAYCNDMSTNCPTWARRGHCSEGHFMAYMRMNCKRSCSLCASG